ncbi:MAG: hypothetical protein WA324_24200 [Bryobacteraceae bacterium]
MSTLAANSAASPSLSLRALETANPWQTARESDENSLSFLGEQRRSNASATASDFCSQITDENFGPMCVCRYVSRLSLGHCFGAIPAPGGTASLCFGYAALRVMVPP